MFRNTRMAITAKFAAAVLIAALIGAGTAAADDISDVKVTNSGKLPVKVVILNLSFGRLSTSNPEFISGSGGGGTAHLSPKVNAYHWEAFAKGPDGRQDAEPCDSDHRHGVSASSITVHCDHTIVGEAKKVEDKKTAEAKKVEDKNTAQQGTAQQGTAQQGSGQQQKSPPKLRLDPEQLAKEVEKADDDLEQVRKELDQVRQALDSLNRKDPKAGQKIDALYDQTEALYKRSVNDKETITRIKIILQGWAAASPIVTHPPDWTKIDQELKGLGNTFKGLGSLCTPTGDVTGGDAGSNAPPPTNIDPSSKGKHAGGCKWNF
jgi:hypothetical protein